MFFLNLLRNNLFYADSSYRIESARAII